MEDKPGKCYCHHDAPGPLSSLDEDGNPDHRYKWRLEDLFASEGGWHVVEEFSNKQECDVNKHFEITKGFEASFSETTAHSLNMDYTVSASASLGIKAASFDYSMEGEIISEVSHSATMAASEHYEETEETSYKVPAHSCVRYEQIKINQKDTWNGVQMRCGVIEYHQLSDCPDNPGWIGAESETPCPPDLIVDVGVHEDGYDSIPGSEAVLFTEPQAIVTDVPLAVYGFSAIGFGVVMYGAFKHYSAKGTHPYTEVTPLERA